MATWSSRGLRGSTLEEFINHTNERYTEMGLALIQKIPTPITPVKIDQEHRHITLAYFDKISTVDYIGAVQGIPVCFDAKECKADTFPLQNIHEHQVDFHGEIRETGRHLFPAHILQHERRTLLYEIRTDPPVLGRGQRGGRKSFRYEELEPGWFMEFRQGYFIPYLDMIQKDLDCREDQDL